MVQRNARAVGQDGPIPSVVRRAGHLIRCRQALRCRPASTTAATVEQLKCNTCTFEDGSRNPLNCFSWTFLSDRLVWWNENGWIIFRCLFVCWENCPDHLSKDDIVDREMKQRTELSVSEAHIPVRGTLYAIVAFNRTVLCYTYTPVVGYDLPMNSSYMHDCYILLLIGAWWSVSLKSFDILMVNWISLSLRPFLYAKLNSRHDPAIGDIIGAFFTFVSLPSNAIFMCE